MASWKDRLNAQFGGTPTATAQNALPVSDWKKRLNESSLSMAVRQQQAAKDKAREDTIAKANSETEKYLQEYNDATTGFWGSINTRFGASPSAPSLKLSYDSPALKTAMKTTQENAKNLAKSIGQNAREGTKNFLTSETIQSDVYDIFYQNKLDTQSLDLLTKNTKTIVELSKRNKVEADPEKRFRRQTAIDALMQSNIKFANEAGGEIKDKTTRQLVFQSLETAVELAPPLGAGLTAAGRAIMALGTKQALMSLGKEAVLFGSLVGAGLEGQKADATPESVAKSSATYGVFGALTAIVPGLTKWLVRTGGKSGSVIVDKIMGRNAEKITPVEEKLLQEGILAVEQDTAKNIAKNTPIKPKEIPVGENITARFTDKTGAPIEVTGTVEKVSTSAPKVQTAKSLEAGTVKEKAPVTIASIRKADGTLAKVDLSSAEMKLYKTEQVEQKAPQKTATASKGETPTLSSKKVLKEIEPVFGTEQGKTKSKSYVKLNKFLKEQGYEGDLGYQKKSHVAEVDSSAKLINTDAKEAYRVGLGYKNKKGVLNTVTNTALDFLSRSKGDFDTAAILYANRTRQGTRIAKELSGMRVAGTESTGAKYLRQVIASNMLRAERMSSSRLRRLRESVSPKNENILDGAVSAESKKIEDFIKKEKENISDTMKIIDSIIC